MNNLDGMLMGFSLERAMAMPQPQMKEMLWRAEVTRQRAQAEV